MRNRASIYPIGDKAITVKFGDEISPEINGRVIAFAQYLSKQVVDGIIESVPTYTDVTIYYNPLILSYEEIKRRIQGWLNQKMTYQIENQRLIYLPVLYGGEYGPDLDYVANYHGIDREEVIRVHTSIDYRVYMLGFAPGFPYLGGLPEILHTPRLEKPRVQIPAGSVGIAGKQTGVYPLSTPGGWQIIGHTPVPLFEKKEESNPILLRAGDLIRFVSIDLIQYEQIEEQIRKGIYQVQIERIERMSGYEN
ncbi:5-oxoprolinase subunit PxpB [Tepidibacillus fermentans]|uniref:5-oxoprolinase subunit PxpB n=1 Tax=Tepidibacillus fermentans TaxID=1281767 RepID=UPI001FB5180E|nr:5-oxoprolinase subunit PxpB [Tepidibacillus fermentans]